MNDDISAVKRRIRKLLALSKSPNENEAVSALEKARRLMDEHHLTEGECRYARRDVKSVKRLSKWRGVLACAVAWLNYCETFRGALSGKQVFFGEDLDAFMAAEMFGYLTKTIERMARRNIRRNAKRAFREAYKLGAACRIACRIDEMGNAASWLPGREGRLLAVRKAREEQVPDLVMENLKLTGTGSRAFRQGSRDGKSISLNRQATGHGGRLLEEGKDV